MGMFDKDKTYGGKRLADEVELGEEFVMFGVNIQHNAVEVPGDTKDEKKLIDKTVLTMAKLNGKGDYEGEVFFAGTLSGAIADKARDAEESDFPAVVMTAEVESDFPQPAYVLQWVRPYTGKMPKPDDMPVRDFGETIPA